MVAIRIRARGAQIVSGFQALVRPNVQVRLMFGAQVSIELLGHHNTSLGFSRWRRVAVQGDFAEWRGFALYQRNRNVARHHISAAQFESSYRSALLHVGYFHNGQLKIWQARVTQGGLLSREYFVMVSIFYQPDNLVPVAFLHALPVDENRVARAGITRLVRTVVSTRDKQL